MIEGNVEAKTLTKELREAMRAASKLACKEAALHVASTVWNILRLVQSQTRWKKPGGWGWWSEKIPHGFIRESPKIGDYEGKSTGGWLRLSDLYYPVEGGTQRGKRGFGKRGGSEYGIVQGRRESREVYLNSARRGPSKPQPFLHPAIEANEARVAEALEKSWNQAKIEKGQV